jgi:3-dehydro-L-gulonate 2-dehydrogenase
MSDSERTGGELRVPFDAVRRKLQEILVSRGLTPRRAARCAFLVAENSLVGVSSHGVHRFPRLIDWIDRGFVDVAARPTRVSGLGAAERWDGNLGIGPLNAERCMRRAMALASKYGVGSVALSNTNHWLRAGTYGWQAANRGYAAICFTNTEPNLPLWGGTEPRLGNNPIALAVPRGDGRHVVYDGALSQFSYGRIEQAALRGENLPAVGGFDRNGNPTSDPTEILESRRALPIGYWKGAGLSLLIDLLVAGLSGGRTTADLGRLEAEYGVSQLFVAFAPTMLGPSARDAVERTLQEVLREDGGSVGDLRYPGERLERTRRENLRLGVPVDEAVWKEVLALP